MADTRYRPAKGVYPPDSLRRVIARLIGEIGARAAARELGVHREQLISIAANVPVLEGTIALVTQRLRERGAAQ